MSIEHDDDLLLSSIAAGSAAPEGDDFAGLLAAWHADLVADPLPALRPAVEEERAPIPLPLPLPNQRRSFFRRTSAPASPGGASPNGTSAGDRRKPSPRPSKGPDAAAPGGQGQGRPRRFRMPRPAIVAAAAAVLAFGGLTVASASAQPGTPLWPITRVIFGDTAKTRVAEQEAEKLLDQARTAMNAGDKVRAAQLVEAAKLQIGQITDPEAQQRLLAEADALLTQIQQMPLSVGPTPLPGQTPQPGGATPAPSTSDGGGILPPLPTITLPPLLPSGILPSLPLPKLPLIE